jgi:capsular polysaccharide transport system permease protein
MAAGTSLLRSLAIQRRVLGALLLREILTRFGRHNIGFLWLFAEPMLFTLAVTALWTATDAIHGSSIPIVAFGVTGYSAVLLWRSMPTRCIKAIEPNHALMYHRNVKALDIYLARVVLEGMGAGISFVVLSLLFMFTGWMEPPEDVLTIGLGWILLAWLGVGLGIFLGALSETVDAVEKIWPPLSYILFPISGAAFVVDALPTRMQELVLLIPMVHGAEIIRDGYFGSAFHAHYSVGYLVGWCVALSLLGLARVRVMSREISPQ